MNPLARLFRRPRTVELISKPITFGRWLEALYVAGISENDPFDPTDEAVPVETCRRLCVTLYEDPPREATEMAAIAWRGLEATRAQAIEWASGEVDILTRLWGSPGKGPGLPIMDHLVSLDEVDGGGGNALVGFAALLDRPLWQAMLFLYTRPIVSGGHAANRKLKGRTN